MRDALLLLFNQLDCMTIVFHSQSRDFCFFFFFSFFIMIFATHSEHREKTCLFQMFFLEDTHTRVNPFLDARGRVKDSVVLFLVRHK